MKKMLGRTTAPYTNAMSAVALACLPAALLLASCNAPPAPAAPAAPAAQTTVIERRPVIEGPSLTVVVSPEEQRRRDDEQRRRDAEHSH